jgi:hypothetical protein
VENSWPFIVSVQASVKMKIDTWRNSSDFDTIWIIVLYFWNVIRMLGGAEVGIRCGLRRIDHFPDENPHSGPLRG